MQFRSDELTLEGHLALPERIPSAGAPGFVICHGFPTAAIGAARSGQSYHSLADRIAEAKGAAVLAMHYRGCGGSEGDFSLAGWLRDIEAAIDTMADRDDDVKIGVKSTAVLFGDGALTMVLVLQVSTLFVWYLAGDSLEFGTAYFVTLGVIAALFVRQHLMVRVEPSLEGNEARRQRAAYTDAFRSNVWVGFVLFAGIVIELDWSLLRSLVG